MTLMVECSYICHRIFSALQDDIHKQSVTSPSFSDDRKYENMFNVPASDAPKEKPCDQPQPVTVTHTVKSPDSLQDEQIQGAMESI